MSFSEGEAFRSLKLAQAGSFVDGSFSLLRFAPTDGSNARGMMICLPATAIADNVSTDENGVIVAIRSNETTTCIVWLVDAQSIGATEADVAALANEGLGLDPCGCRFRPIHCLDTGRCDGSLADFTKGGRSESMACEIFHCLG